MKRNGSDDQRGGPSRGAAVSAATRDDLALAVRALAESERLRSRAVAALARVRSRGDGEAVAGMPVTQHLRWHTNVRRGTVTTIGTITDVADELPSIIAALESGAITLDQAGAIAWPAARVSRQLRRLLDTSLTTEPGWTGWSPEFLEVEATRLLEDLAPARTEADELERAERQFLFVESTFDGQGIRFNGQAHGIDAAYINAKLETTSDTPEATEPDPDGILVGQPTRRSNQLFEGLLRIFRASDAAADVSGAGPDVTIYAIVDETAVGAGSGEVVTARRGLAPRLSTATIRRLQAEGARRVEVFAVDREIVAVAGRAGHTLNDPARLSEDTTRIIITVRDRTCRMPGCDRPVEHLHHLIHRGQPGCTDDPSNLAGLCLACHQLVHRWRWSGTVGAVGRIGWARPGTNEPIVTAGRLARRLPRPPPAPPPVDEYGDPLPF